MEEFVWGGDLRALWRELYALDATGTRMASQYWGVPRATGGTRPGAPEPPAENARAVGGPAPPAPNRDGSGPAWWRQAAAGGAAVAPWWLWVLALVGLAVGRRRGAVAAWAAAPIVTAILPALVLYVEPRSLLVLVPVLAIFAAGAIARLLELAVTTPRPARVAATLFAVAVPLVLLWPSARDLARSWPNAQPLQQVATAQRAVGTYLRQRLPERAVVVSWHPAIAIYARRDWRVLPYASFDAVVRYARAQGAAAIVFSRFAPSPLSPPPRAFTVVELVGRRQDERGAGVPAAAAGDAEPELGGQAVQLEPVDSTPLLFVARLAAGPVRANGAGPAR